MNFVENIKIVEIYILLKFDRFFIKDVIKVKNRIDF